jgi:ribonuclease E
MTKPVAVVDDSPALVPQGVQYEVKATVEGTAGSASARQSAVAPMTKPPAVE